MSGSRHSIALPSAMVLLCAPAFAQATLRASVSSGGVQGDGESLYPTISANGRYVAFASSAMNLVAGDANGFRDVFVRDLVLGTTELASVDSAGVQGSGDSGGPSVDSVSISADARFVAFTSAASNLVPGDTNAALDVFVRDRIAGTTERVSVASDGSQADLDCFDPSISADGRYVAFHSSATSLVPGDTNSVSDVFVRDRLSGTTERASVDSNGAQANGASRYASISSDGRFVVFASTASNLVANDANGFEDVFVRDRIAGTTEIVSVASSGTRGDADSYYVSSISADGRFVAFGSLADDLVPVDANGVVDVFVRDRIAGTTELASVSSAGVQANARSDRCSISADGRFVAFQSSASNLVSGDANGVYDVFVRDRVNGTTELASLSTAGAQGIGGSGEPSISADGRRIAFYSSASNLVEGDTNAVGDVFVRDRDATGFTSICAPGVDGVIVCPCSNPPSGANRGCDNSSSTGGASLAATGIAYLSADTLVFTTTGEKPSATSILLQGTSVAGSGIVYGQGVRCVAGSLRRLFVKNASSGSITAPDFAAGDPPVSARSAAKGDAIHAGESRWYLVYYRDPTVLGGCPATSTFDATQTGRVSWSL
jgi:Tol biopolymer transport system component